MRPLRIIGAIFIFGSMVHFLTDRSVVAFDLTFLVGSLVLLWDNFRHRNAPMGHFQSWLAAERKERLQG